MGEQTARLPAGWKDRLVPLRTSATAGTTGLCLEVHDLAVSKLVAGRAKDAEYVAALLRHGLARADTIEVRLTVTALSDEERRQCVARLRRLR